MSSHAVRFGEAELLRDLDRSDAWLVCVDGVPQSYVDLDDPTHLEFEYVRLLADVVDVTVDGSVRAVHLGGGACSLARRLAVTHPGSAQTVVDADGPLLELLAAELGLPGLPGIETVVDDARAAVTVMERGSADLVVVDVFSGAVVPSHVTTTEFFTEVRRVVGDGVVLANVGDANGLPFARRLAATLGATVGDVALLAEAPVLRGRRFGNVVLAASAAGLPVDELARLGAGRTPRVRVVAGDALGSLVADAEPLTDADPMPSPVPPNGWQLGGR